MTKAAIKLRPIPPAMNVSAALDLFGRGFAGDHVSGTVEWIKNAVDAYIREDVADANQFILLRFAVPGRRKQDWVFDCVDFVGATYDEVDEALRVWCNPEAASRGGAFDTYGGHGNGGKFHMRENFNRSLFVTYRDERLTVFGFDKSREYGYDDRFKGTEVPADDALELAGLKGVNYLPDSVKEAWARNDIGFTCVRGFAPKHMQRWRGWEDFIEKLQRHPQARQLLDRIPLSVVVNGAVEVEDLNGPSIPPKTGFEDPRSWDIPPTIKLEGTDIRLAPGDEPIGTLILRTSAEQFPRRGENSLMNSVDIKGKVGVLASYRMSELAISNFLGAQFLYGVCECPVLEQLGCKENERKKLVHNDYSAAILNWLSECVDEYADQLIEASQKKRQTEQNTVTSRLNSILNAWKNQFLNRIFIDVTAGPGEGPGKGGSGGGGGGGGAGKGGTDGGNGGDKTKDGGGAGDRTARTQKFPLVLVSGVDADPITGQDPYILDPNHDVIHQRLEDARRNIWWINGQRPLAERIRHEHGVESERWRDYLLQRYIDIIMTYVVDSRWKEATEPTPDDVTQWMMETLGQIHNSAARDLAQFLFGEIRDDAAAPNGE